MVSWREVNDFDGHELMTHRVGSIITMSWIVSSTSVNWYSPPLIFLKVLIGVFWKWEIFVNSSDD